MKIFRTDEMGEIIIKIDEKSNIKIYRKFNKE